MLRNFLSIMCNGNASVFLDTAAQYIDAQFAHMFYIDWYQTKMAVNCRPV
jgi:hypothetical protein